MARLIMVVLVACLAGGCASAPKVRVASYQPTQAAMELECMGDCLDESDADCDECAARCFAPATGVLLGLSR
jgi:hypothetical protein